MKLPPIPDDELARLAALRRLFDLPPVAELVS
jgi:hypothetical protein